LQSQQTQLEVAFLTVEIYDKIGPAEIPVAKPREGEKLLWKLPNRLSFRK
jgi:hypothetical protein